MHAVSVLHTNVLTYLRVSKEAGYDAVELWALHLERYLDVGNRVEDLAPALGALHPAMISTLHGIERQDPDARRELRRRCERLSAAAQVLNCPALQVIILDSLEGYSWPEQRAKMAQALAELADIAAPYGVRLGLEPVAPDTTLDSLAHALDVIDAADRKNVGLVADIFHLWAGGASWEEIAALDPDMLDCAHIGDATPPTTDKWTDDDRAALPGDGIAPLKEGIVALREAGYDDVWTVEMWSPPHWEWDPVHLAHELKRRAEALLAD
jgi:sugar phosphate isomerase/epimerase